MRRIVKYGVEAREELARGAKFLADSVGATLGPFGQNWFLEKKKRPTNDGAKIAAEIQLKDEVQNLGLSALREATTKTNEEAGDGTTTATVLAWAIYEAASRFLAKKGVISNQKTPSDIVAQIERERNEIDMKLVSSATPIESEQDLINSAKVATESEGLGELIGRAQWELGKDGYLMAEETSEPMSTWERVSGVRIDNGFGGSTTIAINNVERGTLEVQDVAVILTSYTIRDFLALKPAFDSFLRTGKREVAIIARAWTEEAIKDCQMNSQQGILRVYPMNAPYVDMQERFHDLVAVTGAKFYDVESSELSDLTMQDFGFAKRIVARRWDAFIAGADDPLTQDRILKRTEELNKKMSATDSIFEKKNLSERIAQLNKGFGIIKVGSPSDMERKRLFDKCEDAVHAVRAAFQGGTVKGAGLAFKEIADDLPDDYILKRPLYSIYNQIMSSAPDGFKVEEWVRDPLKVMRVALEKACLAAASFVTAGGVIVTETPKPLDEMFKRNEEKKE